MSKQKGRDYSEMLIWSAAIVTVVRYAAAFIASDVGEITGTLSQIITLFMGISGLGMGILDVFGGAYLFDGWRRAMPMTGKAWSFRFKILTVFVFALIMAGIGILVPFTISRVTHQSMAGVLHSESLTLWAILVNIAPYLLIGGVAIGSQIVTIANAEPPRTTDEQEANIRANSSRKYGSLTNTEKYYILNNKSSDAANELGVTPRAVQKWRNKVQEEIAQGRL